MPTQILGHSLIDIFAAHELQASLVMRGTTGFGAKQHLRTDRLLTLSEDLPMVSVAVNSRNRITAMLEEVQDLRFDGLVTLERARMLTDRTTIFGWLYVVATREAFRLCARDRRHLHLDAMLPAASTDAVIAHSLSLDDILGAREALELLASLPDRQRADLTLLVAGFSYNGSPN